MSLNISDIKAKSPGRKNIKIPLTVKASQSPAYRSISTYRGMNSSLLNRIKPERVNMDRERLFEEMLYLKLQYNQMQRDMKKVRTRNAQLEKELNRQTGLLREQQPDAELRGPISTKSSYLTTGLKAQIKDLRHQLERKDEQIDRLKRNTKVTRLNELEVEIQAYVDECNRLKHQLTEARSRGDGEEPPSRDERLRELKEMQSQVERLQGVIDVQKKENRQLKDQLKGSEQRIIVKKKGKGKGDIRGVNREVVRLKMENDRLREEGAKRDKEMDQEVQRLQKLLKEQMIEMNEFKQHSQNFDISQGHNVLQQLRKVLESDSGIFNKLFSGAEISKDEFINQRSLIGVLEKFGLKLEANAITVLWQFLQIPFYAKAEDFKHAIKRYITPDSRKSSQQTKVPEKLLKHLSMRMQLHRIPLEQIAQIIMTDQSYIPDKIPLHDIIKGFTCTPLSFTKSQAQKIVQFIARDSKQHLDETELLLRLQKYVVH